MRVRAAVVFAMWCAMAASAGDAGEQSGANRNAVSIPPFGCALESMEDGHFPMFEGFNAAFLARWPDRPAVAAVKTPLLYDKWAGPYRNASGERWVNRINEWYQAGTASGLSQDTFRSFDNGHSSLRMQFFPQMNSEKPVGSFGRQCEYIFPRRVTMGVQSFGSAGDRLSVIEHLSRQFLRSFYESKPAHPVFQRFYRAFYENNFLFVAPAANSFRTTDDAISFLSPFYLHSIGTSGTDARLMKPLAFASAALPPELKTRILRQGLFVPTLIYLFKSHIAGDIKSPNAHASAYSLPAEAADDFEGPTPFLDGLLNAAHTLDHIPPVCRMRIESVSVETEKAQTGPDDATAAGATAAAYHEENTYAFTGALKEGQAFVLKVDLRYSWTDHDLPIHEYYTAILRGQATIEYANDEKSRMTIRIPWIPVGKVRDFRTDLLLLVHDGTYFSAPAYISIRNCSKLDPILLGIKAR